MNDTPTTKNHITDEAARRLAVEPLPSDHPEVTGAGPVTAVNDADGGDAAPVVEDKANRAPGVDDVDEGEPVGRAPGIDDVDEGEPVGRNNHGVAP